MVNIFAIHIDISVYIINTSHNTDDDAKFYFWIIVNDLLIALTSYFRSSKCVVSIKDNIIEDNKIIAQDKKKNYLRNKEVYWFILR